MLYCTLVMFITYTLYCTCLHVSVTFTALYLLQWLKACFPTICSFSALQVSLKRYLLDTIE